MGLNRFAKRQDGNAAMLIELARKLGMIVAYTDKPLDLLTWSRKRGWIPTEIKTEVGRYTAAQKKFMAECELNGAPTLTWRDETDVIKSL